MTNYSAFERLKETQLQPQSNMYRSEIPLVVLCVKLYRRTSIGIERCVAPNRNRDVWVSFGMVRGDLVGQQDAAGPFVTLSWSYRMHASEMR